MWYSRQLHRSSSNDASLSPIHLLFNFNMKTYQIEDELFIVFDSIAFFVPLFDWMLEHFRKCQMKNAYRYEEQEKHTSYDAKYHSKINDIEIFTQIADKCGLIPWSNNFRHMNHIIGIEMAFDFARNIRWCNATKTIEDENQTEILDVQFPYPFTCGICID